MLTPERCAERSLYSSSAENSRRQRAQQHVRDAFLDEQWREENRGRWIFNNLGVVLDVHKFASHNRLRPEGSASRYISLTIPETQPPELAMKFANCGYVFIRRLIW